MRYEGRKITRIERRVVARAGELIDRFRLIEAGDRVMACVSGGKDSFALLETLLILQRRSPVAFELVAVNLDQGWPGYDQARVRAWLEGRAVPVHLARRDHAAAVEDKLRAGTVPCSLCSRLRRGALYGIAEELGCTKVALGHHLDDAADSLLLNLFFNGRLASLPPRLAARDGRNVVIRPLLAVTEAEVVELARSRGYPVQRCGCPFVCAGAGERLRVRALVDELERAHPRVRDSVRRALANVQTEFLWVGREGRSPPPEPQPRDE